MYTQRLLPIASASVSKCLTTLVGTRIFRSRVFGVRFDMVPSLQNIARPPAYGSPMAQGDTLRSQLNTAESMDEVNGLILESLKSYHNVSLL
jgi:hypothetical protein